MCSKENKLAALLHDAHEAYIGDMSSPLKQYLPEYRGVEGPLAEDLLMHFGLHPRLPDEVKEKDYHALLFEGSLLIDNFWDFVEDGGFGPISVAEANHIVREYDYLVEYVAPAQDESIKKAFLGKYSYWKTPDWKAA